MIRFMCAAAFALCLAVSAPTSLLAAPAPPVKPGFQALTKAGEKIPFNADHYLTFGFDKPPKLGMAIMRVEIFTRDGKRDTSFTVKGDADMPSMRGAHAAGEKAYSLSAKGIYLMPVRLVMPGDWEVTFTISSKGKTIYRGAYLFDL
jgi:hypothetical protein